MGRTRRGALVAVAALAVAAAPGAGVAQAAENLVATAGFNFVPNQVVIDQGGSLSYFNADPVPHNVVSEAVDADGIPLFTSGSPQPIGSVSSVEGVSALPPGNYAFYCQPHQFMTGTLRVVATPEPPPLAPALP